jgi:hypothetical protein
MVVVGVVEVHGDVEFNSTGKKNKMMTGFMVSERE